MWKKLLVIIAVVAIAVFCLSGCKKSSSEAEPNEPDVKTSAEYEAEAEEEITEENMDAELEKIEKAVEEETTTEQ